MIHFTEEQRRASFESLVLRGIWVLILRSFGANPKTYAHSFRADAVSYMDEVGNQSDGARAYRRENDFPELRM